LVLDNVKLNDSTLLVEVVEILHFVTVDIVYNGVVERNVGSLKVDFLNCALNISLVLAVYGNLALISLRRGLLNVDLDTELVLNALDLRALRTND
jgi:hypothetical protein